MFTSPLSTDPYQNFFGEEWSKASDRNSTRTMPYTIMEFNKCSVSLNLSLDGKLYVLPLLAIIIHDNHKEG